MSAAFNTSDRGDSVVNEAKTSDAPQFDLKSLYSDMSNTTRSGSKKIDSGDQLDFGPSDIFSRISSRDDSNNGFNLEQQGAMDIAKHFASFDDDKDNHSNDFSFDREDAGRLVEVYGDMFNAQQSLQEGDKTDAKNWLSEMRRDLTDFAKGLFSDSDNQNADHGHHGGHHRRHEDYGHEERDSEECPQDKCPPSSEAEHGGESESEQGSEHAEEHGSEHGSEHGAESGDSHIGSGSEGFTPQDSMVLLQNDMQELSQALASGDMEAVQKIMERMSRHLAMMMQQLGQSEDGGQGTEDPVHGSPRETTDPVADRSNPLDPIGMLHNPFDLSADPSKLGDLLMGIPNPGDLARGLPSPLDLANGLPAPGDLFNSLPTPGDILSGLPQPGDLLSALPKPADLPGLPGLPKLPNPGQVLENLPKPPKPADLLNPAKLLDSFPKPGDIFDLF